MNHRLICAFALALVFALAPAAFAFGADEEDTAPDPVVIAFITGQQEQPQGVKAEAAPAEAAPLAEAAETEDAAMPAGEATAEREAAPCKCEADADGETEAVAGEEAVLAVEEPAEGKLAAEVAAEAQPPATPEQDIAAGLELLKPAAETKPEPLAEAEKQVGEFFGPQQTRSLHPLHQYFFNFPADRARTLGKGRSELAVRIHAASNMAKEASGGAVVDFDLENWVYQLELRKSAWGGEITAIVPLKNNTHGLLDNVIKRWHGLFELFPGDRPHYPAHDYHFFVRDPLGNVLNVPSDQFGLGDISFIWKNEIGKSVPGRALAYRAGVKLPTGDFGDGLGSGGMDAGIGLAYETLGKRWAGYANLNYVFTSQGDFVGFQVRDIVTGSLAAEYRLRPTWWVTGQLDYAQYPLATGSGLDIDSLEILFGFHKLLEKELVFSGGFSEDVNTESAPDFGIIAELRWRF